MVDLTAKLFSVTPNWRESYSQTFEFKTDIITSRAGREQRRALRTLPRKGMQFTATAIGSALNSFVAGMVQNQNKLLVVPDQLRRFVTSSDISAGVTSFSDADLPDWFVNDIWLVFQYGETQALYAVDHVSGVTVNLTDLLAESWPAGTSIYYGMVGYLRDGIRAQMPTNAVSEASIDFGINPGTDLNDDLGTTGPLFNGREVFNLRPNWTSALDQTYQFTPEIVDMSVGVIRAFQPIAWPSKLEQANFVGRNADEAAQIRTLFNRMKGQRGEFYRPTWINDLPPITPLASGQNTLKVAGTDVQGAYVGSTVYKAIRVLLSDGTELYRAVTDIYLSSGDSMLQLASNWPSNIPLSNIVMVSWMPVWRFASDLLTMEWLTDSVAQASLTMKMLEDLPGV